MRSKQQHERRDSMSSITSKKNQTRRAFFSDLTASTALAAMALAQLGSPTAAMAQEQ